jgi:hypothetical protein
MVKHLWEKKENFAKEYISPIGALALVLYSGLKFKSINYLKFEPSLVLQRKP